MANAALKTRDSAFAPPSAVKPPRKPPGPPGISEGDRRGYPGEGLSTFQLSELARELVAKGVFGCSPLLLMSKPRGDRVLAVARQLAIHLVHIIAGRPHEDVAKQFSRNRSTASHHFEVVEDLRSDAQFDAFLSMLEAQFVCMIQLREADLKGAWKQATASLAHMVNEGGLEGDAHFSAEYIARTMGEDVV